MGKVCGVDSTSRPAKRWVKGEKKMGWGVKNGHDDHVVALALVLEAAKRSGPEGAGGLVNRRMEFVGGRY